MSKTVCGWTGFGFIVAAIVCAASAIFPLLPLGTNAMSDTLMLTFAGNALMTAKPKALWLALYISGLFLAMNLLKYSGIVSNIGPLKAKPWVVPADPIGLVLCVAVLLAVSFAMRSARPEGEPGPDNGADVKEPGRL